MEEVGVGLPAPACLDWESAASGGRQLLEQEVKWDRQLLSRESGPSGAFPQEETAAGVSSTVQLHKGPESRQGSRQGERGRINPSKGTSRVWEVLDGAALLVT